jgi:hypothetical protein
MSSPQPFPPTPLPEDMPEGVPNSATEPVVKLLTPLAVLPLRRMAADSASTTSAADRIGLRIESQVHRVELSHSTSRIAVQEITGSIPRLDQVIPPPQKVPRQVKFHELPPREEGKTSTSEEGAKWGLEKQRSGSWIIGAGIGVGVIVVLCLILLPLVNSSYASRKKPAADTPRPSVEIIQQVNPLAGKSSEALNKFLSFVTATTPEEARPHLRDHKELRDRLQKSWQPTGLPVGWQPSAKCEWILSPQPTHPRAILHGFLPDQAEFTAYFIHDGRQLKLDWEATTAYSTASFTDLAKAQGNPSEIRGILSTTNYYNATWPEKDYQSFKLISPDKETTLWCYTRRAGPADTAITEFFRTTGASGDTSGHRRVTLKLAPGTAQKLPNQWLIQEFLHQDWSHP